MIFFFQIFVKYCTLRIKYKIFKKMIDIKIVIFFTIFAIVVLSEFIINEYNYIINSEIITKDFINIFLYEVDKLYIGIYVLLPMISGLFIFCNMYIIFENFIY